MAKYVLVFFLGIGVSHAFHPDFVDEFVCQPCGDFHFCTNSERFACPNNSLIKYEANPSSIEDCICRNGYLRVNDTCDDGTPPLYYIDGQALECPSFAETRQERADKLQLCACIEGYNYISQHHQQCEACISGTFNPNWNSSFCTLCPANSFHNLHASKVITDCHCNAGFTGQNGSACTACVGGKFKSRVGDANCSLCNRREYSNGTASTACLDCHLHSDTIGLATTVSDCLCEPGFELANAETPACIQCAAGKFKNSTENVPCKSCPAGHYQNATGQTVCLLCSPNSQPDENLTGCLCNSGYQNISPLPNPTCQACNLGFYKTDASNTPCLSCPDSNHTTHQLGSVAIGECFCRQGFSGDTFECSACEVGFYKDFVSTETREDCLSCPANATSRVASTRLVDCQCLPGFFGENGTDCSACERGHVKNTTGPDDCVACPINHYQPLKAQTACLDCIDRSTTEGKTGQTSIKDCICDAGNPRIILDGSDFCAACPPGTFASTEGCQNCSSRSYQPEFGQLSCLSCGPNSTSFYPHVRCFCDPGFTCDLSFDPSVPTGPAFLNLADYVLHRLNSYRFIYSMPSRWNDNQLPHTRDPLWSDYGGELPIDEIDTKNWYDIPNYDRDWYKKAVVNEPQKEYNFYANHHGLLAKCSSGFVYEQYCGPRAAFDTVLNWAFTGWLDFRPSPDYNEQYTLNSLSILPELQGERLQEALITEFDSGDVMIIYMRHYGEDDGPHKLSNYPSARIPYPNPDAGYLPEEWGCEEVYPFYYADQTFMAPETIEFTYGNSFIELKSICNPKRRAPFFIWVETASGAIVKYHVKLLEMFDWRFNLFVYVMTTKKDPKIYLEDASVYYTSPHAGHHIHPEQGHRNKDLSDPANYKYRTELYDENDNSLFRIDNEPEFTTDVLRGSKIHLTNPRSCSPNKQITGQCVPCEANFFKTRFGHDACSVCQLDAQSPIASIEESACKCNRGFHQDGPSTCVECDGGTFSDQYDESGLDAEVCADCAQYHYTPDVPADDVDHCTLCDLCPDNHYWESGCNHPHQYPSDGHLNSTCILCPLLSGTEHPASLIAFPNKTNAGIQSCTCFPGAFFRDDDSGTGCTFCPKGFFKEVFGNHPCTKCPSNTSTNLCTLTDTSHCDEKFDCACDAGFYYTPDGCKLCNVGSAKPLAANTNCTICPAHENSWDFSGRNLIVGATACVCDPGFTRAGSICLPCAPGKNKSTGGDEPCSNCPTGTFQDESGQTACKPCPPNSDNVPDEGIEPNLQLADYVLHRLNSYRFIYSMPSRWNDNQLPITRVPLWSEYGGELTIDEIDTKRGLENPNYDSNWYKKIVSNEPQNQYNWLANHHGLIMKCRSGYTYDVQCGPHAAFDTVLLWAFTGWLDFRMTPTYNEQYTLNSLSILPELQGESLQEALITEFDSGEVMIIYMRHYGSEGDLKPSNFPDPRIPYPNPDAEYLPEEWGCEEVYPFYYADQSFMPPETVEQAQGNSFIELKAICNSRRRAPFFIWVETASGAIVKYHVKLLEMFNRQLNMFVYVMTTFRDPKIYLEDGTIQFTAVWQHHMHPDGGHRNKDLSLPANYKYRTELYDENGNSLFRINNEPEFTADVLRGSKIYFENPQQAGATFCNCNAGFENSNGTHYLSTGTECRSCISRSTFKEENGNEPCAECTALCQPNERFFEACTVVSDLACQPCQDNHSTIPFANVFHFCFCEGGFEFNVSAMEICEACPVGKARPHIHNNDILCQDCVLGESFSSHPAQTNCSVCNKTCGSINGSYTQYVTEECTITSQIVCVDCQLCPAGQYESVPCGSNNDRNDTVCAICPVGFYCPGGEIRQPQACPELKTSPPGSIAEDDCLCQDGYYLPCAGPIPNFVQITTDKLLHFDHDKETTLPLLTSTNPPHSDSYQTLSVFASLWNHDTSLFELVSGGDYDYHRPKNLCSMEKIDGVFIINKPCYQGVSDVAETDKAYWFPLYVFADETLTRVLFEVRMYENSKNFHTFQPAYTEDRQASYTYLIGNYFFGLDPRVGVGCSESTLLQGILDVKAGIVLDGTDDSCKECGYNHYCFDATRNACPQFAFTFGTTSTHVLDCQCRRGHHRVFDSNEVMSCPRCEPGDWCFENNAYNCSDDRMLTYHPAFSRFNCTCEDGWYNDPTDTFCIPCPIDSYCFNGELHSCSDERWTQNLMHQSHASDCFCRPGSIAINSSDPYSLCQECGPNTFCEGDHVQHACPSNSTSNASSENVFDCLCNPGFGGEVTATTLKCVACGVSEPTFSDVFSLDPCENCTVCEDKLTYALKVCLPYRDTQCVPCTNCDIFPTKFESTPCNIIADTICSNCSICNYTIDFEALPCGDLDTKCEAIIFNSSECEPTQYRGGHTKTTQSQCLPCQSRHTPYFGFQLHRFTSDFRVYNDPMQCSIECVGASKIIDINNQSLGCETCETGNFLNKQLQNFDPFTQQSVVLLAGSPMFCKMTIVFCLHWKRKMFCLSMLFK